LAKNAASVIEREVRRRNPEATKADILKVATNEFTTNGYNGARVDAIALATNTTKRMIYYYFGSKEGLYIAVLESVYEHFFASEDQPDFDEMTPPEAIRAYAEWSFGQHALQPDFIRLVQIENVNGGRYISKSQKVTDLFSQSVPHIESILQRGIKTGDFRSDINAFEVRMMMSSFAFFHVGNRFTVKQIYGYDMLDAAAHDRYRKLAGDMIVKVLCI
jgi:AcrR family transcriptional regulator